MVHRVSHGGQCCGINNIYGFGATETKERIQSLINISERNRRSRGMVFEVVLTNQQCKNYPDHPKWLQELGFKLVTRFINPNSGNICNVFHYNKYPKSLTLRLPFKIVPEDTVT